ncbi:VanZ family protein [Tenacibaculum aquimarinum]|uniref:VanZ family protein n=1 Tax=Tenacibaculum aquimarinum TaxID=2910675 RepID=UPI001F0A7D58|nr:VanZ family protein [Tenacibaculum aquimarinum]MCH3884051.1 VanZ family protein [Tenacibaculum aquimarinum]
MLKHIKNLLKDNIFFIAIAITIAIAVLSLIKLGNQPVVAISNIDKIEHLIAYLVLTLSWLFAVRATLSKNKIKYSVVIGCILYGIIIEVLQGTITDYREASYLDMLANTLGAIIAMLIFNKKIEKKRAI